MSLRRGRFVEEPALPPQDAQLDPLIHQFPECFVLLGLLAEFIHGIRPDEPADLFAPVDISELFIRTMSLGMIGVRASASATAAHLILLGHASGMHGAELEQGFPDGIDFSF